MITNHAQALEGLRNAREQLHDVVLFLKGSDTETEWAAHVALDWTRNAIHYGEEEALSDVLHAMHSGLDTRTQDERRRMIVLVFFTTCKACGDTHRVYA